MRPLPAEPRRDTGRDAVRELLALAHDGVLPADAVPTVHRVIAHAERLEQDLADLETIHAITVEASTTLENELSMRYDAVTSFLASTSHELRTPLHTVIGHSELVLEELADTGNHRHDRDLLRIRDSANHLLALINGILDLSKVESGRIELCAEPVDVCAIVLDLQAELAPLARTNRNTLVADANVDGWIVGDPVRIRQCVLNLVANGLKFTTDGMVRVAVRREADLRGEWLVVVVSDTGIGMSEDQLERVFRPYAQATRHTYRQFGGTGLGLALTKSLCDRMGADLTVESALGHGSTFVMRLPTVVSLHETPRPA